MTAHSAKGLEFDHVFVLRAISPSFPAMYHEPLIELPRELRNSASAGGCSEKEAQKQEERRLFYVAMTRARDTLSLYAPFGRGKNDKTPPGFLRELLSARGLKTWLRQRDCRRFQTDIFGEAEAPSRLEEWIALPSASDLAARLSASAIERYEICPLQFKLEREWRIPTEPAGRDAVWGGHASGTAHVLPIGASGAPEVGSRIDRAVPPGPGAGRFLRPLPA